MPGQLWHLRQLARSVRELTTASQTTLGGHHSYPGQSLALTKASQVCLLAHHCLPGQTESSPQQARSTLEFTTAGHVSLFARYS
jgi:hypothetical protein